MMSMNLRSIAISNINDIDYCCIITEISKNKAINLLQKAELNKIVENYQIIKKTCSNIKMGKELLTFGNIETKKKKN